jgi:hypothetical protein
MAQTDPVPTSPLKCPSGSPNITAEIERISTGSPLITTKRDEDFHLWLSNQRDSKTCGIALSAHRSGVSESCQYYRLQHVRYRGAILLLPVPIVYVRVPSGCTPAQLFVEALQVLHRNLKFGRIGDLRNRVRATLKEYGVQLLIIDDAHYLKLKALRELVQLHELLKIPVVLSGTSELYEQLKSEWKQVHNSFLAFYTFPTLTIDQTASVVDTWLNNFLGWEEESDLLYEDVLKKLHEKTGGLTGPLNDTLQKIAIQALKKGLGRLDEKTIYEVLDGQMSAVTS